MRFMVTSRSKLVDYLSEIYSEKCRDKNCNTAQKIKFSIKNFFSKCDQIHRKLRKQMLNYGLVLKTFIGLLVLIKMNGQNYTST